MRTFGIICLAVMLAACEPSASAEPPTSSSPARSANSQADMQALMEKGAADAERNSKVTRRPRRFDGESL
jgi:hypothetical protein